MTEKSTTLSTAEKIKSFAMGLIGSGIFSMGSTYFSPQAAYRIPRILLPVYELFGHTGLAIGMIILGAILMFFAYRKFTAHGGRSMYLLIFLVIAVLGFYGIIFATGSKSATTGAVKTSLENNEKRKQEKIASAGRPDMNSKLANTYLDNLEALEKKFEQAVNEKNKPAFDECEKEYITLVDEFGNIAKEIGTKPEYGAFAMYNARILEKIQLSRTHKW